MCSGRRSASSVLGAPAQPLFHGANAERTTALGRDRCLGHDRSCRAQHAPRRLQTRCATRPLAQSLSWSLAEGFNDTQLDDDSLPQQWQSNRSVRSLFHDGSYWRVLTVRIASLEVRKGRLNLSERHRKPRSLGSTVSTRPRRHSISADAVAVPRPSLSPEIDKRPNEATAPAHFGAGLRSEGTQKGKSPSPLTDALFGRAYRVCA